jgi:shikimate dehydrogenase
LAEKWASISIGLYPDVDALPDLDCASLRPDLAVWDVIPTPPETRFLQEAAARGAQTINGLGMFVHQGAIAFEMWTGQQPPVDVMKSALTKTFAQE